MVDNEFYNYLCENFKSCEVLASGYYAKDKIGNEYFFSADCTSGDVSLTGYFPGSAGSRNDTALRNHLLTEGIPSKSVVTIASESRDKLNILGVFDSVAKDTNINVTNAQTVVFSNSGDVGFTSLNEYINNNPDIENCSVVDIDGYCIDENIISGRYSCDTLKERQVPIYMVCSSSQGYVNRVAKMTETLSKKDYNIYLMTVTGDLIHNGVKNDHSGVRNRVIDDGVYLYLAGNSNGILNASDYAVYKYTDGVAQLVSLSDARTIDGFSAKLSNLSSLSDVSSMGSISSDSGVLVGYLNDILGQVKSSSFINQSSYNPNLSSTTNVPKQIPVAVKDYFSSTADLLQKIAYDVYQFAKIGESYEQLDANMSAEANALGGEVLATAPVAASAALASAIEEIPSSANAVSDVQEAPVGVSQENLGNEVLGDQGNKDGLVLEETTINEENKNGQQNVNSASQEETKGLVNDEDKADVGTANVVDSKNNTTEQQITSTNKAPSYGQSSATHNNNASHSSNSYHSSEDSGDTQTVVEKNPIEEFEKYEEICSDENRIVYNYNDEYKIIIHKDGDKIIGLEHYYDFGTNEEAIKAIGMLQANYQNEAFFKEIINNDRYVKVIFDESMYAGMTLNDIMEKYIGLTEAIRP